MKKDNHGSVVSEVAKNKDNDWNDNDNDTHDHDHDHDDSVCEVLDLEAVLGSDSILSIKDGVISLTTYTDFGTETFNYTDSDEDGIYVRTSEQWLVTNEDLPLAKVPHYQDELVYTGSDLDDLVAVRSNIDATGGEGNDTFVVREAGNLVITDFSADDQLHFDLGLGLTSFEHLLSFVTDAFYEADDFVVEFGEAATLVFEDLEIGVLGVEDIFVYS